MKAKVTAHSAYTIADIDKRLYGSFLEHLGRAVYTGIYEPGHPTADASGMRGDVLELVRALDTPICRYPGGNFVSAYNWEDGIGPKDQRPKRLDLAWRTTETNQVGIHEFADWAEKANTDMMLAVNLGSRGLDEARAFVEYVNHKGGTCGSSHSNMPTYPQWEATVLEETYDQISLHVYFETCEKNYNEFLALPQKLDIALRARKAACDGHTSASR